MPEIFADLPAPSCYRLFPGPGIEESQRLGADPFLPRARELREGKLRQSARRAAEHPQSPAPLARPRRSPLFFAVFSLLSPLFLAVIFLSCNAKHEVFRARGRSLPLFFRGITAKTADRGSNRPLTRPCPRKRGEGEDADELLALL
jgi:hypothetical protein